MPSKPVIAIIDVGKTNKKLFLFDEDYKIVYERSARFTETVDEDGDACENLESLRKSVFDSLHDIFNRKEFSVKAINFSTYGASFVYVDKNGHELTPLYSYLKNYPEKLKKNFYGDYGGEENFAAQTASPVLGSLNSGMQLYRLKYEKPEIFEKIKYALHLPQYLSYLISSGAFTDITSIGCHTNLWNFNENRYHEWVYREKIAEKFAPIVPSDYALPAKFDGNKFQLGIGLHDSSAALIPYLISFQEPFILISTGTWCISLNPFNTKPLTVEELKQDCLCYMQYQGLPVKASRLFAGQEHEEQVKRIADHFNQNPLRYRTMGFNPAIIAQLKKRNKKGPASGLLQASPFADRDLSKFATDEEAYHQLMLDIIYQQYASTQLVLKGTDVKRVFVDGGFSKNAVYMNLLAAIFPHIEVLAASMAQATAMGAALAIHSAWNKKPLPNNIIQLQYYSLTHDPVL
jgi:sugar (pentulose or hexulose) kinase